VSAQDAPSLTRSRGRCRTRRESYPGSKTRMIERGKPWPAAAAVTPGESLHSPRARERQEYRCRRGVQATPGGCGGARRHQRLRVGDGKSLILASQVSATQIELGHGEALLQRHSVDQV
jgi:hypothetical protein